VQKFVTSLLALVLSAPIAFAQTPEKPTFPERPYQATSQYFRDLVAAQPMENVRPITQHFPLSTSKDVFDYDFGRFGSHVRSIPLELGIIGG